MDYPAQQDKSGWQHPRKQPCRASLFVLVSPGSRRENRVLAERTAFRLLPAPRLRPLLLLCRAELVNSRGRGAAAGGCQSRPPTAGLSPCTPLRLPLTTMPRGLAWGSCKDGVVLVLTRYPARSCTGLSRSTARVSQHHKARWGEAKAKTRGER